jgi:uncharacterized membrane protein YgcG
MTVTETIKVIATGNQIKRGIVRAIPTKYQRPVIGEYYVDLSIEKTLHNNKPVNSFINHVPFGIELYLGNQNQYIEPGVHVFTIVYTTKRQLLYFTDHDELYWNVTGNFWRLPIMRAQATVRLPKNVPESLIKAEAYTGFFGEKDRNYTVIKNKDGSLTFKTTKPLERSYDRSQGLTIVVSWPKGYVSEPSLIEQLGFLIKDFQYQLWMSFISLVLLAFIARSYYIIRKEQRFGTIIPQFYPPAGITPGGVNYLINQDFNIAAFSAEIVEMAVQGYLTIEYVKESWFGGSYKLHKKKSPEESAAQIHKEIYAQLFNEQNTITIGRESPDAGYAALKKAATRIDLSYGPLLKFYSMYAAVAWIIALAGIIIGVLFFAGVGHTHWDVVWGALLLITTFIFSRRCYGYTPVGKKIIEDIQGFKLFLATTEQERMKIIGTPPTRTPELYEKYLPYAMALGVEDQWNKQFTPIFQTLKEQGHAYVPVWYVGPQTTGFATFQPHNFVNNMSSSFAPALKSTTSFSSGTGGGGSSGGGRGGGGGGGW